MPLTAEVSGTKAYAYVIKDDLYLVSDDIKDANANIPFKDVPESLPHAFDLFLDSVHSGESTNLVTPKEAAYRSTVMEAIYEAAATRKWVNVEPYN